MNLVTRIRFSSDIVILQSLHGSAEEEEKGMNNISDKSHIGSLLDRAELYNDPTKLLKQP